MKAVSQSEILALIVDINVFADNAEGLIIATQKSYDREKQNIHLRHTNAISTLEKNYQNSCASLKAKSQKAIRDAAQMLGEVTKLDEKLCGVDKYYVKTKKKKEELLVDRTSSNYDDATDYFEAMEKIKGEFNVLFKKYSEDILPGLINGLNYLFSSQRKKDYEELIILKNTIASFKKEIDAELPTVTEEGLTALRDDYLTQKETITERQKNEAKAFESKHEITLDEVANKICTELDNILPDEFVEYLALLMNKYDALVFKVNSTNSLIDELYNLMYVEYPIDFFVQSPIVASVIKDKCNKILVNGAIRFPIAISINDAPTWLINNDNSNQSAVQEFVHSVMFGLLSSIPVSQLVYTVVDPENRGNSIAPYFDAKKKLPEMFNDKIYISKEDISQKVSTLNEYIEDTLQNRLGNQYENIFDYAVNHEEFTLKIEYLMLFDFPKGFDERTLGELRNILRNGTRCGIITMISYLPSVGDRYSNEFELNLKSIMELSTVITQRENTFSISGLQLLYYPMPDKNDFSKFFGKYMLIFEGIQNRGIAFSPLIKKLADAKDSVELEEHIGFIRNMMRIYDRNYSRVPDIDIEFPRLITLGSVQYPADIFSDSVGYQQIIDTFGVGEITEEQIGFVELPLTFDLRNSFNIFANSPESSAEDIRLFTHHIIWSFLSFLPVTKVNICVFDSVQRGNSIIPFLDFRKKCPDVFDQKIYTSQEDITDRLIKINNQIDEFIQEKLGNKYVDILDYNQNTPNRAETITLLVLYDFPGGMDGRSLELLKNILRNGNKCGVFTMICYNPDITFSRYENIDDHLSAIMKNCTAIEFKDNHFKLLPYNLQTQIPNLLNNSGIEEFVQVYYEKSEVIKKKGLSFKDILSKDLFAKSSAKSLSIPIGVGDGDSIISMTIGEGSSHHGLIAGATGSGKSTLLHTLIMSSMLHYSPDQLHLYLMDFKSGTEFKVYESVRLPHIQLLALDAMQEFGESILENLVKEMENRGKLFKEAGQTSLKGYTQETGQPLPRILVIMDEFQILFNDSTNRKVAMNCAELTKRIVTEGRAFGIHLLMATQSTKVISDLTLSHGTIEQMRIRVGLKCGESDARYLFSDENDTKALSMMKGPIGTAVMNLDYTELANIGFRAAYCDNDTQKEYLELISEKFADVPYNLQTFEGGRTVKLLDYYKSADISLNNESTVQIHMGTLIKVAPPFAITIDKKKKHNLLVCGANERMANIVSNNFMISALLNQNSTVYCIDGDVLVGEETSKDIYDALTEATNRFRAAENRADIIRFIRDVFKKYQEWKKQNSNEVIFVVIKNLQFLDIVKSMLKAETFDESEYIDDEPVVVAENSADPFAAINNMFADRSSGDNLSTGEKLVKMIEDGSGFGIHFVVTSMEYQTVREVMYYGENVLTKFQERIIFSLGGNDADNLIENVSVSGLRDNTVYYTDGVKNTFQMKPYITPMASDIATLFK